MTNYEISQDLINKLQISLRKESGLSPYQPSDHTPPSESILLDAISAVGSNAQDAFLCQGCNGDLLRGFDSIICVFCGRFPSKLRDTSSTPTPTPICFTSTFGYQWFLRSLSLDGSDSVERSIEGENESGRGRSPVTNEIPLSALLDLQLKWPDESNIFGVEIEPGKQPAKLVGLNIDELCQTERSQEGASGSSIEQKVVSDQFVGQGSLSLFETAPKESKDGENDESDWAVEFQSANADVKVESGFDTDSTHWPLNQEESGNTMHFQDLPLSIIESKPEIPFDSRHSENNMIGKDDPKGLETFDASLDWLPAADKQRIGDKGYPPHNDKLDKDDSSNKWDGLEMFSGAEDNREHINATMPVSENGDGFDLYDSWNDFTESVGARHNQLQSNLDVDKPVYGVGNQAESLRLSSTTKEVDDSLDLWNDFVDTNQHKITYIEAPGGKLSPAVDGTLKAFNDTAVLSVGVKKQDAGSSEAVGGSSALWNDNSLDIWNDFAQSTGTLDSKPISNETSFGALSDFSSIMVTPANPLQSSNTKSADNQTILPDDDEFGSWSDFRSSWKQPDSSFSELNTNGSSQDKISTGINVENLSLAEDKNSHNSFGNFSWSASILNQPSHAVEVKPSESKPASEDHDLFLGFFSSEKQSISVSDNQLKSNGTVVQNDKSTSANDEEIDVWTDFTTSGNCQANNWHSSYVNAPTTQEPVIHDLFDDLNGIGSAPTKRSGNVDTQFGDSTSSMHQDPFLGMLNNQNGFAQLSSTQTEMPNLVRTEHQDVEAGDFDKGSETVFMESNDQKSAVVENLISEMHDLYFMLESSLSIPKAGT